MRSAMPWGSIPGRPLSGSDDQAVVDGDFAMREAELQPVLKALRGAGIHVVAIHQHMTMESPRIIFLHYWGVGATRAFADRVESGTCHSARNGHGERIHNAAVTLSDVPCQHERTISHGPEHLRH